MQQDAKPKLILQLLSQQREQQRMVRLRHTSTTNSVSARAAASTSATRAYDDLVKVALAKHEETAVRRSDAALRARLLQQQRLLPEVLARGDGAHFRYPLHIHVHELTHGATDYEVHLQGCVALLLWKRRKQKKKNEEKKKKMKKKKKKKEEEEEEQRKTGSARKAESASDRSRR